MQSLLFGARSDAFTHVCIDIGIACVLFSLSLSHSLSLSFSSQHILHGELSDPRLIKQALILSSGAGYYWYHLPAYHAKIPATLQHISKRTWWGKTECDTSATNPSYILKYCNPRWAGQYAVRNSIQKDPFATQTVQLPLLWSDAMRVLSAPMSWSAQDTAIHFDK